MIERENIIEHCDLCETKTAFTSLFTYTHTRLEGITTEHTFSECKICHRPAIFTRLDCGEGYDDHFQIFPGNDRILRFQLPEIVKLSYDEAVSCEIAKLWTACVVMVGRTLEAICIEHFPNTKTIHKGLLEMFNKGYVSQELLEWSDELRFLRNAGAHATTKKINKQDAEEAMDFLQAILEIIYHLRPKFQNRKSRKKVNDT